MLHVLNYITAKPGMCNPVVQEFRANMPAVHAEEGCIEYIPLVDLPAFGPSQTKLGLNTFVVAEKWASPEAIEAHAAAPHMRAYAERTADMIETRMIHILSPQ
jgi:quinol monooxygenase YgiN